MTFDDTRLLESGGGARKLESGDIRVLESYGAAAAGFSDDFNRADGSAGANWLSLLDQAWIRSGTLQTETANEGIFVPTVQTATPFCFAQATFTTPTGQEFRGIFVCSDAATHVGYQLRRYTFGGAFDLLRMGSYVTSFPGDAIGTHLIRVEVINNGGGTVDVVGYKNGVELGRWTDTSPITDRYTGVWMSPYTTGCTAENYSHGDL